MKKATILTLESQKRETLILLRKLGVVHINPMIAESEELAALLERRSFFEKALRSIPQENRKDGTYTFKKDASAIAEDAITLHERLVITKENLDRLIQEYETLRPWGDFQPDMVRELKEKGVDLHFCTIKQRDMEYLPEELDYIILKKIKDKSWLAIIGDPGNLPFSYRELSLPEKSLNNIITMIDEKKNEYNRVKSELNSLAQARQVIQEEIKKLNRDLEFEQVRAGMEAREQVAYLTGFVPVLSIENLKKKAKESRWGLILEDPNEEDMVPTLIKNPKWISIINPVFDFLGTVPGYHEADISFWFLLFFSLFTAMIIGDAGYGLLILILTIIARMNLKKAPAGPFVLFTVLGIATIIWGALTGTWFGVEQIARLPAFSWMVIDSIASFPVHASAVQVQQFFMNICFTIAIIHLTLAHILNFIRQFPHLKAFANPGKILLLWGLYLLIQTIVLKKPPIPATLWLIGIGYGINFIFTEQDRNFFKGLLSGLINFIPITLGCISCFGDIISYVRLFAVGLATVKIAETFNGMAAGVGFHSIAIIGSVLILIAGHSLNIVMSGMSVIVHGVRLNLLEFSGHMDLQWSGTNYKPFS